MLAHHRAMERRHSFFCGSGTYGKTHNAAGENCIVYGNLCISGGMTGTCDKIEKMLKKTQKNVDYGTREDYNLPVFERETKINKCL